MIFVLFVFKKRVTVNKLFKEGKNMGTSELLDLLNDAINREIYVSVSYMLQHSIWSVPEKGTSGKQT